MNDFIHSLFDAESNKLTTGNLTELTNFSPEVIEFMLLIEELFGKNYQYLPEKSDKEIIAEVLTDGYA